MPVANKRLVLDAKRGKMKDERRETIKMMCGHKDCIYASAMLGGSCDYLERVGHSRGCPPDKNCDKYKKVKRRKKSAE